MTSPLMLDLRAATKDAYSTWRQFMGIPTDDGVQVPYTLKDFGRQPADEAWVFRCMDIRSDSAASVPLRVQVRVGKEWVDVDETTDSAGLDLQFLLDDVNPSWDGAGLQAFTEAGAAIHGGSAWKKVRGRLGGPPQELYWLSAADLKPAPFAGAYPNAYEYRPNGNDGEVIEAKDIIVHRDTVNLQNPYAFLSPLSAARQQIAALRAMGEANQSLINNWGVPPGAWVADKDIDFGPTERSLIKRALNAVRGPKNQGKMPVLPGGLKWVQMSMSPVDADWVNSGKVSRMVACAVLGVPLPIAGDDQKMSVYGSIRDAERVLWRMKMIPTLDKRSSRIDSWLVPDFDKTRKHLRVRYDYGSIESLRAAPAEDMQQFRGFVAQGLPLNRALARFGERPVEGGDEARFPDLNGNAQGAGVEGDNPTHGLARPTEYQQTQKTALPDHLYRNTAVKAYIDSGDPSVLQALVPEHLIPALAEGIRQRDSAEQIEARLQEDTP